MGHQRNERKSKSSWNLMKKQNLWNTAKAVLRGKYIINAYIVSNLKMHVLSQSCISDS
jgi:hypothetical protein